MVDRGFTCFRGRPRSSRGPHSAAAKAGRLGKVEGGPRRRVWVVIRECGSCPSTISTRYGSGRPDLLESTRGRPLPHLPPADVRGGGRAGGGGSFLYQRGHHREGAPGLPV